MRKLIILMSVVFALCIMATSASADVAFTNTCGQSGDIGGEPAGLDTDNSIIWGYNGVDANGVPRWTAQFVMNCGFGGKLEYEIQHEVGGSFGDMHEWNGGDIDHQLTSNVVGETNVNKNPGSLNFCVSGDKYRLRVYWVNSANDTVVFNWPNSSGIAVC